MGITQYDNEQNLRSINSLEKLKPDDSRHIKRAYGLANTPRLYYACYKGNTAFQIMSFYYKANI
jgi:hypothetical protein